MLKGSLFLLLFLTACATKSEFRNDDIKECYEKSSELFGLNKATPEQQQKFLEEKGKTVKQYIIEGCEEFERRQKFDKEHGK